MDPSSVRIELAIMSSEEKDWAAINRAIIARWSNSALNYIKAKAWKMAKAKQPQRATP